MKIEVRASKDSRVKFDSLANGECFHVGDIYYMKLGKIITHPAVDGWAVMLGSAELVLLSAADMILPVDAKVVIER